MLFDRGCLICDARVGPACRQCEAGFARHGSFDCAGLDRCRSAFLLDANVLMLVAALKYRGERRVARWFGEHMQALVPSAADVITWVPTTSERRNKSGYDHGRELARAVANSSGLPCRQLLGRHGERRQTGRSRADRAAGPALHATGQSAQFVVVVDDITTTGSSLRVAAEQLRLAGATRVVGLTAARTPSRSVVNRA